MFYENNVSSPTNNKCSYIINLHLNIGMIMYCLHIQIY